MRQPSLREGIRTEEREISGNPILLARDEETRDRKPKRSVLGLRNLLNVPGLDMKNWSYRWVNDKSGRIQEALDADWEFSPEAQVKIEADDNPNAPGQMGSRISRPVGQGVTAFLMRKRMDWYLADQKLKYKEAEEKENSFNFSKGYRDVLPGSDGVSVYAPNDGGVEISRNG